MSSSTWFSPNNKKILFSDSKVEIAELKKICPVQLFSRHRVASKSNERTKPTSRELGKTYFKLNLKKHHLLVFHSSVVASWQQQPGAANTGHWNEVVHLQMAGLAVVGLWVWCCQRADDIKRNFPENASGGTFFTAG